MIHLDLPRLTAVNPGGLMLVSTLNESIIDVKKLNWQDNIILYKRFRLGTAINKNSRPFINYILGLHTQESTKSTFLK